MRLSDPLCAHSQLEVELGCDNASNSGLFVLPATPKDSACTSQRPIIFLKKGVWGNQAPVENSKDFINIFIKPVTNRILNLSHYGLEKED